MMQKSVIAGSALLLAACASQPEKISASYVSTQNYAAYDCRQMAGEAKRITRRTTELHGELKEAADNDAVQMGIGLVLFWPALFLLEGGDGTEANEYARLKGERGAIEKAALEKKCAIAFEPIKPAPVTAAEKSD